MECSDDVLTQIDRSVIEPCRHAMAERRLGRDREIDHRMKGKQPYWLDNLMKR